MNEQKISAWMREWLVLSAAVLFATWALAGISCSNLLTLLLVAAVISLLNTFLRPLLILISMPFLIATFGLGMILVLWLINSWFLYIAGNLFVGFHVASFGTAMVGALFISAAQFFLNAFFGIPNKKIKIAGTEAPPPPPPPQPKPHSRRRENDDDVIDI